MKHTNRQAIGLESFFASRSANFSGLNEYSAEDIRTLAGQTPAFARYHIGRELRGFLEELMASDCCPAELIPSGISRLVTQYSAAQCASREAIVDFYTWLLELSRKNESDRVERIAGLNTAAACFDRQTASVIRTALALNNQRVFISRAEDCITITYAEREWGQLHIDFSGCTTDSDFPPLPMPGYAFAAEAECLKDGGFEFRLLIDTRFTDLDYCQRLLQPMGWHELVIRCSKVSVRAVCCDYAGRLFSLGTPRSEMVDRVCSTLINKHTLLGDDALCSRESSMLPIARLITGSGGLLFDHKSKRWSNEQMVLDSLDNRYAMQQFGRILTDSSCTRLGEQLAQSGRALFEDDEAGSLRGIRNFAALYEHQLAEGSARPLLMELCDRMCEMTGEFEGTTRKLQSEHFASQLVKSAVEDQLTALKFEGSFPHYRRSKRRRTEYLSFMLLPAADVTRMGLYSYNVSLAAAQVTGSRLRELNERGIARERTNALDCQPELPSVCRYGELASADDGEFVRVDACLFEHSRPATMRNDTDRLRRYIKLANRQFRFGRLPVGYRLSRLRKNTLPSPAPRIFLSTLPFSAVFSLLCLVVLLLLTDRLELPEITFGQAIGCAAGLCVILNSVLTVLRRIHIAGRLWRYR